MKKIISISLIMVLILTAFVSCNGDVDERLWERKDKEPVAGTVTVTFVSNGGSEVASQTIEKGKCAVKPEDPTFGENTFKGWFLKGSSEEFDFSTAVNEDITLYANWEGLVETKSSKKTIDLTVGDIIEVTTSPVSSSSTSVEIPANAISKTGSSSSELAITSYSIEVSTTAFTIVDQSSVNNLAVAGIDCTLKIDDEIVSDFNKPLIVTTFIPKGLSSVQVVYKGDDGKSQPVADDNSATNVAAIFTSDSDMGDKLGYSKESGKLRFKTEHFSEFYVATNAEVCIVNDSDETDISAMTLGEFRDDVNNGNTYEDRTVTLLKNIDLNDEYWTPIGCMNADWMFCGIFDGNGKEISGLNVDTEKLGSAPDFWPGALFGYTSGNSEKPSQIKNLIVKGKTDCAGIVGYAEFTTIDGCTSYVDSELCYNISGGFIAHADEYVVINNSVNYGNFICKSSADYCEVGGFVGRFYGGNHCVVKNCQNYGNITWAGENAGGKQRSLGGIVAGFYNSGALTNPVKCLIKSCTNYGTIVNKDATSGTTTTTTGGIGGIVGKPFLQGNGIGIDISNCRNEGLIVSSGRAGGIVGTLNEAWQNIGKFTTVHNCINVGTIYGDSDVGEIYGIIITNSSDPDKDTVLSCNTENGSVKSYDNWNWD